MELVESTPRSIRSIWSLRLAGSAIVAAYLGPHITRLSHPSLYGDDITRIWNLQNLPWRQIIFSPFNEHVAPVFDTVSWISWKLSGQRLSLSSEVFTLASFVPFLLVLLALAAFAKRELGSWSASVFTLSVFAIAPIHVVETVWWYSGSNHMWALFGLLVALLGASRGGVLGAVAAFLGTLISPACSAMGLISGPATATWIAANYGRKRGAIAIAALAGTITYLLVASGLGLVGAVEYGVRHHTNASLGLMTAAEAPSTVLLPALLGLGDLDLRVAPAIGAALSVILAVVVLAVSRRGSTRAVIVLGLVLIVGEYTLIYPFRVRDGMGAALRIARFHLFPQLGLALLICSLFKRTLASRHGPAVAVCVSIVLLLIHLPQMFRDARLYEFPNQAQTFAAMERVQAIAIDQGITREQILDALEPIQPRWLPIDRRDANVLRLIGPTVPHASIPNREVRSRILAGLIAEEREGIFGSEDVSKYLVPANPTSISWELSAHTVQSQNLKAMPTPGVFKSDGGPAYQEFAWDDTADSLETAQALVISARDQLQGVEVWWSDDNDRWSEGRSVKWRIAPDRPGAQWAIPLEMMPHWDRHKARHIRIQFRYPGIVWVEPPKLIREDSSKRHQSALH